MSLNLAPHELKLVLMQPQIAPNTGNIARLCVATGTQLHIVRPMGFVLSDRELRRSAMDYWPRLKLTVHDDDKAFLQTLGERRPWLLSSKGTASLWDVRFAADDWLIFGNETHGLSDALLTRFAAQTIRIPQIDGERCLNLATAAGIALYESIRQVTCDRTAGFRNS